MKYITALLMGAALCAWGLHRAAALRKKTDCLTAVRNMLEKCAETIERKSCDARELLRELSECPSLSCFSFLSGALSLMLAGMSFSDAFFASSNETGELDALGAQEKQLLNDYICQLSSSPREKLLKESRIYAQLFEKSAGRAAEYSRNTGKLYVASGVLSAMIIIIIVLQKKGGGARCYRCAVRRRYEYRHYFQNCGCWAYCGSA